MPQLRVILRTPRGGAEVWDEEVTVENRQNGIIAISRERNMEALVLAADRAVWISETPQSESAEYSIVGTDGPNTVLAQLRH